MTWTIFLAEVSPDPTIALIVASLILIFAAAAGIYQRFDSINLKAENNRLDAALRAAEVRCNERCCGCEERCRKLDDELWLVKQQLREVREKLQCQTIDSGSPTSKSSPTPIDHT